MLISIITPTFNSEKTLDKCIDSVIKQNFDNYEHLIIDNISKDNSEKIVKNYNNNKIKFLSEKDNGIYDAMNKGIKISKGDYLLFLNSDDKIIDNNFFTNASIKLKERSIDILYSNITYSKKNLLSRKYITGHKNNIYKLGFHLPHPGTLIKRKYLYNLGLYDTTYKISADFDFFMKAKKLNHTRYYYYNNFTIMMSPGGASSGFKNIFYANIECYKSLKKNKIEKPVLFIFLKLVRKFFQFF